MIIKRILSIIAISVGLILLVAFTQHQTYNQYSNTYTVSHIFGSNIYVIDLGSEVKENHPAYMAINTLLRSLDQNDTVIFKLHSYGGSVATGQILINAMDITKAHTVADVVGGSYSMGAVITCHAKEVVMHPNSYLMFHNARTNFGVIPPGDMRTSINRSLEACVANNILTRDQVNQMNSATDDLEIYWYPSKEPAAISTPIKDHP